MSDYEDYLQPDFFRFGSDSLFLVHELLKRSCFKNRPSKVLELGAGSGVISCELSQQMNFMEVTLVEAQVEWRYYLELNVNKKLKSKKVKIFWETVGEFNLNGEIQADLIVCNPPYYHPNDGRSSPNVQRNISHRFVLDPWKNWLSCMQRSLAPGGEAWFIHRDIDLKCIQTNFGKDYALTEETHDGKLTLFRVYKEI